MFPSNRQTPSFTPSETMVPIKEEKELAVLSQLSENYKVAMQRSKASQDENIKKYTSKEDPENPRAKMIIRSRIEPKVFFANERTFLSWLNIAILLVFVSLSLIAVQFYAGSSVKDCNDLEIYCRAGQIAGLITAPMAFIIMAYALVTYRKRTFQILRRDMVRIDDQCGPTVLTILLIVILAIAYVLLVIGEFHY
eukprot:TRINITY_DN893_c0_g1_i1.p3 TRINITY_DN893_c0_g1~~TRINITY_DN893_c0_g1_i1.p3  ORF type:complete len:229 (+),score=9.48 TRINITY_DN893_c0_g1_i1:103-687(+)